MSFKAITWAFGTCGLATSEKLLLLVLANYANEDGSCFPSAKLLAEETGLNKDTVFKCLKSLEGKGLLTKSKGVRNSNLYTLCVESVIRKPGYPEKQMSEKADVRKPGCQLSENPDISYPKTRILTSKEPVIEPITAETFPVSTESKQATEEEPQVIQAPEPKAKPRKRAELVSFPQALPEDWARSAKEARPDINGAYVFGKLKARYAGTVTKKAMHTWRREFMNWVGREFARGQSTNNQRASSWVRKDQNEMDYSEESVLHFLGVA